MVKNMFRNRVKDSRSYPAADTNNDHHVGTMKRDGKLKSEDEKKWFKGKSKMKETKKQGQNIVQITLSQKNIEILRKNGGTWKKQS